MLHPASRCVIVHLFTIENGISCNAFQQKGAADASFMPSCSYCGSKSGFTLFISSVLEMCYRMQITSYTFSLLA